MAGEIFLLMKNKTLVEMKEEMYSSEDLLQSLLEEYPKLLAGDQIDSSAPRKWLLVSREMGLPSEEDSGDRWAVDHLFLDQIEQFLALELLLGYPVQIRVLYF